jgi:hypothetical protein
VEATIDCDVRYFRIGRDIGLDTLEQLDCEPDDWHSSQRPQPDEEVIETFLAFHLGQFTAEPVTVFARGGDYWNTCDLMALDTFGRFHLFEVKKGSVNAAVAEQLSNYLLTHLFADAEALLRDWWPRYRMDVLGDRLVLHLAGALADLRTVNLGRKFVSRWADPLAAPETLCQLACQSQWLKIPPIRRKELLIDALQRYAVEHTHLDRAEVPALGTLNALADAWARKLAPTEEPPRPVLIADRKTVIWLVGRTIHPSARERIRLWRRAGIDARWLAVEARRDKHRANWHLRVESEHAPQRAELSRKLLEWIRQDAGQYPLGSVKFELYEDRVPSNTQLDHGGTLAPQCRATVKTAERDTRQFTAGQASC